VRGVQRRGRVRRVGGPGADRGGDAAADEPVATQGGNAMIEARRISKRFGDFVALDDVTVDVPTGSLTALLGPSGSGKSPLLRVPAGQQRPASCSVRPDAAAVTLCPPQTRGGGF